MATTTLIEEDLGTYRGTSTHPHNGYYAGDFFAERRHPDSSTPQALLTLTTPKN